MYPTLLGDATGAKVNSNIRCIEINPDYDNKWFFAGK